MKTTDKLESQKSWPATQNKKWTHSQATKDNWCQKALVPNKDSALVKDIYNN